MAFFQQLRLLLWKNVLGAFRQPTWTITLLAWPLVVFIIIAVTRHQFPPIVKDTCYVGTRNLPSAGFFPFLQTLMCTADSTCSKTSKLVDPSTTKISRSGVQQTSSPLADLIKGRAFFNISVPKNAINDPLKLADFLNNIFGLSFQGSINNVSLGNVNTTLLENQEILDNMRESVNVVKKAMCTLTLPMINTSSSSPIATAMVTFCESNNTVFETSLVTLNQILTDLVVTKPNETMTTVGMLMLVFDQLQNQTSLWESLLAISQLFSPSSDLVLDSTKTLLTSLQGAMQIIQRKFPEADASLSNAHPLLVGGVNMIHYAQNWPGKNVSISLGKIVTLQNDSLSGIVKQVLQDVQIPLDKAVGLILDKSIVHSYLCDNTSNSVLLTAACSTGTVDMALSWISPDMVAKQALLAWSQDVASHDVAFVKGMLQSLTGSSSTGGQGGTMRRRRSVDIQPQSTDEELFLGVGGVAMEIIQIFPQVDMIFQSVLRSGFQVMKSATLAIDTVKDMMFMFLQDTNRLKLNYVALLTNPTEASIWIDRVLDSVMEMTMKSLSSESLTCEDRMGPFEWLLNTESIEIEVWRSVICQNSSAPHGDVLMDWQTLIQQIQAVYSNITIQADYNVTLPMILAEWQNLANSTVQIEMLTEILTTELGGGYWMNWTTNSTFNVTESLQQSHLLFMETFGKNIERSKLWPEVKNSFHIAYWILNYRPGVTTQPANCSINNETLALTGCDTGLNWTQFIEALNQALMSPNEVLVNCLKGALNLLHDVYGGIAKNLTVSYLKQELEGEEALSAYLFNLTQNLFQNVLILPPGNISNPNIMLPLISNLLQPMGLTPLLSLLLSDAPINGSTVLDAAFEFCRFNQQIFTFNETDPEMPFEHKQLIMKILFSEDNLTLPLSHVMGCSLLNYSERLIFDDIVLLKRALKPLHNQTSGDLVDSVLSAMELLKTVMDSPDSDPTSIIIGYIRQLQELLKSLFRPQKGKHIMLPTGQLNITQVDLVSNECLQNLTQAGPEDAQSIVQKVLALLPPEVQPKAALFLCDFRALENKMAESGTGQNWLSAFSEMFTFLNQTLNMLLFSNGNISFQTAANNSVLEELEFEEIASMFFSLFLAPNEVETFIEALHFIKQIMAKPNISVSDIQNAVEQSNLTIDELRNIAARAGDVNISGVLDNTMEMISARQCFESQRDLMATSQCVMEMVDGISSFLMQLPDLCNERDLLNLIPSIINRTVSDISKINFSSSPNTILINTLDKTLANIIMSFQMASLNTTEIMNELKIVQDLIQLFGNTDPFNNIFNTTFKADPIYAQKVYLEIVEWYLKKLENITSNSSVSALLQPFFYLTQMQVTLKLAETDFSSFVSNQVNFLTKSLKYPIDSAGLIKISDAAVEILEHLLELINCNVKVKKTNLSSESLFNTTSLIAAKEQTKQHIKLIEKWMKQANVSLSLTNMLQWRNSSRNVSTYVKDIQQLLETTNFFLSDEQLAYVSVIVNITQSLSNALMLAEGSGLQTDEFLAAILDAVQSVMQILPLPVSTQQDFTEIVEDSLKLIIQPDMSSASSHSISLSFLDAAESVIQHAVPDMYSEYVSYVIEVATTYLQSISTNGEPDSWNQLILKEMQIVQSILPPNCTAQAYVSEIINIFKSGQEITNVWSSFQNASAGNMSTITDKMGNAFSVLWPFIMGGTGSRTTAPSLGDFAYFAPVLEQVMTGKASKDTWDNLEKMLRTTLSSLQGTELWKNVSSVIPQFENIIGSMVNIVQAENALLLSFKMPVVTLMREIAHSVNTSHFNLSEVSEIMPAAIERTANGTLECSEVLQDWEPVREAAGLSYATLAMWCNISVESVLDAYAAAQTVYSHLNLNHMGVGSLNVSDAAARIVNSVQSLYQVSVNRAHVTKQLIMDFSNQLSVLVAQPLSPEAQLYLNKQLQDMELQNSFPPISVFLKELANKAPFLQPYINASENALYYVLNHLILDSSSSQNLLKNTAMIFLTSSNTTLDNIFSMTLENLSGFNETMFTDRMKEAVKLISDKKIFGDAAVVYQAFENFLASNNTCSIVQKVAKMSAWLTSNQGNILDNIFSKLWVKLSTLNETSFTDLMKEPVKLLSDLAFLDGNITSDMISMLWGNFSRMNETSFADTIELLSDLQMFGDAPKEYQAFHQILPPNAARFILQKTAAWLDSIEADITLDKLLSMMWENLSRLNETSFIATLGDASKDTNLIVQKITKIAAFLATTQRDITLANISSVFFENFPGLNETTCMEMLREAVKLLSNLHIIEDAPTVNQALEEFLASNNSKIFMQKLVEISTWLASTQGNITSDNIFSVFLENMPGLNETTFTDMMREALKLLSDLHIIGDAPTVNQALEEFLASNNTRIFMQKLVEISTWLASTQGNITLDNIFTKLCGSLSGLNKTMFTDVMKEAVKLLSDSQSFGDAPLIYQTLENFLASNNKTMIMQKVTELVALLAFTERNITLDNIFSMLWENFSGLNETSFINKMKEVVKLLSDLQIDGDASVVYQTMEQFLSNDTTLIMQKFQMSELLASIESNLTSDNIFSIMWAEFSGVNEAFFTNTIKKAVKLISDLHMFGDAPVKLNQALEQFLALNDSSLTAQKVAEISAWLVSTEGNITSDSIISMMWGNLSELNETSFSNIIKETVKLLTDWQLFRDAPMVNQHLEQFLASESANKILLNVFRVTARWAFTEPNITSDNILSFMWGNASVLNGTTFTDMMRESVSLLSDLQIFGDAPMLYQVLNQFIGSSNTSSILQKLVEMSAWLASTEEQGLGFLEQALPKIFDILTPLFSTLTQKSMDMLADMEMFEELSRNIIAMVRRLWGTTSLVPPVTQNLGMFQQEMMSGNYTMVRYRREASLTLMRDPMDDFIDLFYINYPAMFQAISVPPTTEEIMETVHMFLTNPNLGVVLKGALGNISWGLNASREETIDAALGVLSFFTVPDAFQTPSLDLLRNATSMLPNGLPLSLLLQNISRVVVNESQGNLDLVQQTYQTASELLQTNLTDPQLTVLFNQLRSQVCVLETTETVRLLMASLSMESDQLCKTFLPSLQILVESLLMNMTSLTDAIFQIVIGDPSTYNVQATWTSVLSQNLNFNITSLSAILNINITSPGEVRISEMLRNQTEFVLDVQQRMAFDPTALNLLMETPLPNNNLEILSWFVNLRDCGPSTFVNMPESDVVIQSAFCSMSAEQWYSFSVLMARHLSMEKVIYRMVLSEELQNLVEIMLQIPKVITEMMNKILPSVGQLQKYLLIFQDLKLEANNEFKQLTRGRRSISSKATFVTLSQALCSNGIKAVFAMTKLSLSSESDPSVSSTKQREEMIDRFKIPRDATPFCTNMYLDMVNTTGGAIAWAFLKPMLMGKILYTPNIPVTRDIMQKANATLQEFANLRNNSAGWIETSNYIIKSTEILSSTLPMLQNSLSNSFVKQFIEMQTDINVDRMKETLSSFSDMTVSLEKNKDILNQITTLSMLMVNLSSCIKFDRYQGYDSVDELNTVAQELAKDRNLYASVIFKLPKDQNSTTNRPGRSLSSSSTFSLPPKVSYTIRMHIDNAMRTDKVREPYFVKDNHISPRQSLRYSRGFIYLQDTIDRAIIATQTGQNITEPAVQLQPFPYPCFLRDEYLQAISFVFPLMLMIAWVLFVADFVKKLVHERELRLHEYMKMMGVNPLSHFFAWLLECAAYLLVTIFILTLVLKYGKILPNSNGFILFLYLCDYGLSILAFSYLVSSFFDKTYIAGLSGSLIYILCFFPFIMVMALETNLTFAQKSVLSLFSPTCFSYASQYVSRYETQEQGIHWSNLYSSPLVGDTASFGWLCWMLLIDSTLYFIIGAYIRMVFPGNYGMPAPWYFPFKLSFWADLCCIRSNREVNKGLLFTNIMQKNQPVFPGSKDKGKSTLSHQAGEDTSELPVGVALHGLSKIYGSRVAIENLNVSFYEGHVTTLLGHNGAGKTTTMSLLTGLFPPSSGTIEVYGRDMQNNIDDIRRELGVCMQYDVLFDHLTAKEHLLLYGQIKAPHWSHGELHEQVRTILEETGMHAHRHKLVGTLSGGMKRKLSISIAFIGGSRLVVLDEPTTGVDPCSRRNIWDIVIQYKKHRTIIMSTHHLDEAEVLSDRIAFMEKGGLKCCGSPFYLKDKLGQGYKLTLSKKRHDAESEQIDNAELKAFVQTHVPEARLKESQGGDLIYSLPHFTSSNASSYRSLLTALDSNLDALQLGGYGISDTTLEEVFLQLTRENAGTDDGPLSISETVSDTASIDSFPSDLNDSTSVFGDKIKLTGSSVVRGMALAWQQMAAMLIKRFHHSRRDWKGMISQILLPVMFVIFAMGLGSIKNDLQNYPELELSPALYNIGPSYSFFRNQNPSSSQLVDTMISFPGIDNACHDKPDNPVCNVSGNNWITSGNSSKPFNICQCPRQSQFCDKNSYQPPHEQIPSSQIVYNLTGINVEDYLIATANDFIRNRYGGFEFGLPLPADLQMDLHAVPKNRTLSRVLFNPEGHHTMPAYLNSLNNFILRSNLPANKDPRKYAISVSTHPYFARADDEDVVVQGMLQILVAICIMTGYSITIASFAIYEVNEHHSGSKRLQHIAGISEPFYWAVNFFYDMVVYLIPVTLTVGVIAAFQLPAFTDRLNLGAVTLLLVLFGFATFPWMYLLSGFFKDAEMAFITYVCINLFISVNTVMSTSILYFLSQLSSRNTEAIKDIFNKLSQAFLIFPQFNFGNGLMQLARINVEVQVLIGYGVDAYKNPYSTDALGWMFISSFIQGVFFFTLRLLLNKFLMRKIRHLICGRKTVPQVPCDDEDEDVAAEKLRVSSGAASSDILQVNQLTKVYQHIKKKVHAVKRISVGIPAGECFGLLGVNGAGKTTTFKMLTGDVSPTDGAAQIKDSEGRFVDIMECRNQGINIGYCPQVDALDSLLTGEEHLYFYARIRGISKRDIEGVVNYLLKRLELNYHRNIVTDGYSCGTRRKLSTALALIGHPQILLLDEPSSGMDPRTKRHLWRIISEEVKGKCAVVLTSHSMEECEALCSRLAIMVKGQFRCLGSLQHIKNRFGSGFTVKMYLAEASCDAEAITGFMQRRFPSTYLKDQHSNMVEYHIPLAPGGVADIFDQLESNKNTLQIKHFSVSQTTLDEVFINFAMGKVGMETIPIHSEDESDELDSFKAMETEY